MPTDPISGPNKLATRLTAVSPVKSIFTRQANFMIATPNYCHNLFASVILGPIVDILVNFASYVAPPS
jgi:hypothetical protein